MGDKTDCASARVGIYHDLIFNEHSKRNTLEEWGLYASTLVMRDGLAAIEPEIEKSGIMRNSSLIKKFLNSLNSEMVSRSFILSFLGHKCYTFLNDDIRADLTDAMVLAYERPEDSVRLMGTALEDFIRLLADARRVLLENNGRPINTIGSMIDKLRQAGVLANHHVNALKGIEVCSSADLLQGLNAYRTMPVHGRNPDADVRWSLSTEVALIGTLQLLLSIRSTHHYLVEKQLTY